MPKGVEHNDILKEKILEADSVESLMPKGVEHNRSLSYLILMVHVSNL